MKQRIITILLLLLLAASCANEEPERGNCSSTLTFDGNLQNLSGSCLVDETEHLRLERVEIPEGESLTLYAFASSQSSEDGFQLRLEGGASGRVHIVHPTAGEYTLPETQDLTAGANYCLDLHIEETPIHLLIWKGDNCDLSGASAASTLAAEALFNSEDLTDTLNWSPNDNPTGNFFNYRASSGEIKIQTIQGGEPIFEE